MGAPEVEAFLTHLAVDRSVAASTQNQALAAKFLSSKGKRKNDRVTMLPHRLVEPLQIQLASARALHESDLREGFGRVYLPFALARKYPNADGEWGWQYVFPTRKRSRDPRSGIIRRHHIDEKLIQRGMKRAVREA